MKVLNHGVLTQADIVNNFAALTANGVIKGVIYGETTHNFGNLPSGSGETVQFTVPGVEVGDIGIASIATDIQDEVLSVSVQATNTVEVHLQNQTGGAIDLPEAKIRVLLLDVT